jgi:hypothetical protein
MRIQRTSYKAYGILIAAIIVWLSVGFFAYTIHTEQAHYIAQVQDEINRSDQMSADALLHVVASSSIKRSQQLDALIAPDVQTIINTIRSVGTTSGATIKISAAMPGNAPTNQKDIHAVAFVIESTGSFAELMRTLALFEALPLPSSIDTVDLSYIPQDGTTTSHGARLWHMNIKMQVLTTAVVS